MRAYHRINRLAVELLEPGGMLVTNSCSGAVARDDFLMMLAGVAQRSGRALQLLERATGIDGRRERLARYTTWSDADVAELDDAVAAQRTIDSKLWE